MDFFEEISKTKKEFPKVNSWEKEVKKYRFNFYQWFAIGMFIICFFCQKRTFLLLYPFLCAII